MQITQLKHAGFIVNVRIDTPWLDTNILTEVISSDEYRIHEMKEAGFEPKVVLDIGGHIGGFGLLVKSFWPDVRLIAIEPDPLNAKLYSMNLASNMLGRNTTVLNQAISYNPDCNCLVHSPSTTGGSVLRTRNEAEKYVTEGYRFYNSITDDNVKLTTIEDLCKEFDIEQIDLAKWDCEGGEVDAFLNMSDSTAEKFRYMAGEYHIWDNDSKYLKADLFSSIRFWRRVKQKFPHLNFNYKENRLGLFQAWPK